MHSRKLTVFRKVVNQADKIWRKFVDEVNAITPRPHAGAPTKADAQMWARRIKRWCKAIEFIKPKLDSIYDRLCEGLDDNDITESGTSAD